MILVLYGGLVALQWRLVALPDVRSVTLGDDLESKHELEQLRQELKSVKEQLDRAVAVSGAKEPQDDPETKQQQHPICQSLGSQSTASFWMQHLPFIHKASQLPNDRKYAFSDFTAQLLAAVSPRMHRSLGSLPRDLTLVQHLLDKAWARHRYLKQNGPEAPPIRIVTLGGSVLVGRNCRKLMVDLKAGITLPQRDCSWSNRVQVFLNQFLGEDLVAVTNIALGGSNTAIGNSILAYDLLPLEARDADVVINGYSTNDMHIWTIGQASAQNTTLSDHVLDVLQNFTRSAMDPCRKRLFLHMDDYLGNEQRQVLETMSYAAPLLAQYYGFATMSYANLVRDWVYGDVHEFWFSPKGWWEKDGKPSETMLREIHPQMGMHIVCAWIVAYSLLEMTTTYCAVESFVGKDPFDYAASPVNSVIPLNGVLASVEGKPRETPNGLPPPLDSRLNLETISDEWSRMSTDTSECLKRGSDYTKCIFSWFSGLAIQRSDKNVFAEQLLAVSEENVGWALSTDGDKLGFVPSKVGDRLVLRFDNIKQPIKTVAIFFLRSYGERWDDSWTRWKIEHTSGRETAWVVGEEMLIAGFHAKNTSEIYSEVIELKPEVSEGASIRSSVTLAKGLTFKLMGLAVCGE